MGSHARRLRSLAQLERVQTARRNLAAAALTQAEAARNEAIRLEQERERRLRAVHNRFADRVAALEDVRALELLRFEQEAVAGEVVAARREARMSERSCEVQREAVAEIEAQLAVTERLAERTRDAQQRSAAKAEQRLLDDVAPARRKS